MINYILPHTKIENKILEDPKRKKNTNFIQNKILMLDHQSYKIYYSEHISISNVAYVDKVVCRSNLNKNKQNLTE